MSMLKVVLYVAKFFFHFVFLKNHSILIASGHLEEDLVFLMKNQDETFFRYALALNTK